MTVLRVTGRDAALAFADEAGGHRWQEARTTHGRDKVQTSTVTVAVLPEPSATEVVIRDGDLNWTACRGSGAGGQNRNKTNSAVQLTHLPSGLMVRCESERSQWQNRQTAMGLLRARLWQARQDTVAGQRADSRRAMLGSGQRGDKRRTIRAQDGQVNDHVTGRRWELKRYLRGEW